MMDPNSFAFHSFANQPPGYYTPTPGGTNTVYHNQAGDLHTPSGFTIGLQTPLSLPTSEGAIHAAQQQSGVPMHGFPTLPSHPHPFQTSNPFAMQSHHQEGGFAPHQFHHSEATFNPLEHHSDPHQMGDVGVDVEMHEQSPGVPFMAHPLDAALRPPTTRYPMEKYVPHASKIFSQQPLMYAAFDSTRHSMLLLQ